MLRILVLSLLALTAATTPALATGDLVDVAVDPCEKYYVCPIVRAEPSPLLVCAGLGLGLQGAVVCAYQTQAGATCVRVVIGFHVRDTCQLILDVTPIVDVSLP